MKNKILWIKIVSLVSYLGMIVVNTLANALPINGIDTGAVSDLYPNLFAPTGFTFSIWGVIYLLLFVYNIYQFNFSLSKEESKKKDQLISFMGPYFILSSIVNILWIFSWHYQLIPLTVILLVVMLLCLIKIATHLDKENLSLKNKLLIRLPFSVYFGWVTVATIANISVFLVSLNWSGWGIPDYAWTIVVLLVGMAIGLIRLMKDKDIAYGLVFLWAYYGIYYKHMTFFENAYPSITTTLSLAIVVFIFAELIVISKRILKMGK